MLSNWCPIHGPTVRKVQVDGKWIVSCPRCLMEGNTAPSERPSPQAKRNRPEECLQEAIIAVFEARGMRVRVPVECQDCHAADVLITSRRRFTTRCPACGHTSRNRGGDGASPGIPDLLVWSETRGAWIGLEVKAPSGRLSDAQKALEQAGRVVIVRSVEAALVAVEKGERNENA